MISCVEWIPRGAADPRPRKYELSEAEKQLIREHGSVEDAERAVLLRLEANQQELAGRGDDDDGDGDGDDEDHDEGERMEQEEHEGATTPMTKKTTCLPLVDASKLPADLRMDEYSDDDDDDDGGNNGGGGTATQAAMRLAGQLMGSDMVADFSEEDEDGEGEKNSEGGGEGNDSDSDDDLADVPDTREFVPTNIAGLRDMKLGGGDILLGDDDDDEGEDDASDLDDTNLKPDDCLLLVAKTEDDFASLEVHVYEPSSGNLYVHHDIPLPSFPLCLAHGDISSDGSAGNYCAVGTFDKGIEVWNMDVLNALEPSFVLGGEDGSIADEMMRMGILGGGGGGKGKSKKKGRRRLPPPPGLRPGSHTDAVMSLSWNRIHRQVLASGSADRTVKVWDVTRADSAKDNPCAATYTHHRDKVQSVAWHPSEGAILATGAYDRAVCLVDARSPDGGTNISSSNTNSNGGLKRAKIPADCESIAWDPHRPEYLSAASEDGTVTCWDVRRFESGPVWSFVAHEFGGVSDLSYNSMVPGFLATCAVDGTVALWDTWESAASGAAGLGGASTSVMLPPPQRCGSKDMAVGKLHSVNFYPSAPWLLGCGGSGNTVALWDLREEAPIRNQFGGRAVMVAEGEMEGEGDGAPPANGGSQDEGGTKERDFEAMMAAADGASGGGSKGDGAAEANLGGKKGGKKKKKKKVHRKGN